MESIISLFLGLPSIYKNKHNYFNDQILKLFEPIIESFLTLNDISEAIN